MKQNKQTSTSNTVASHQFAYDPVSTFALTALNTLDGKRATLTAAVLLFAIHLCFAS